jgi:NAD(P)-dependent dehydrogenase (short-subunit alcohol dehydrogenase family)
MNHDVCLAGKRIVLTGATMGIGYAVAKRCATDGAKLVLISRHVNDLRRIGPELGNGPHDIYPLDVSNAHLVAEFVTDLNSRYKFVDGLINCAGIYGPIGRTEDVSPLDFAEAIQINLFGTFYMCHSVLPLLRRSPRGKIVNYSGGGAASPFPNYSAYAVSKIGVVRLTENMAIEYASDGIDINVIAPGFVLTRLHQQTLAAKEKAGKDFLEATKRQIEQGGVPVEKAAELTSFLMSSASDGITGKFISAPWDPWQEASFVNLLKQDKDFATLRRIDNRTFYKRA